VRLGLLGAALLPLGLCPVATAQTEASDTGVEVAPRDALPSSDPAREDEIVVTADRYYGEAEVASETEFGEQEIAGHGADSIQDMLGRLSPFIDPRGEQPVLLINGKPAGDDRAILFYPAEALNRIAVLKPDAAARYGYPSGKRVVNLVLKKHFASLNVDVNLSAATAGGAYGGGLSAGRVAIDGPIRWSVQARIDRDAPLLRSARDLPPRAVAFDGVGYVARTDGAEIDAALSLAAGQVVTVAAIPSGAATRVPTVPDFVAPANRMLAIEADDFETLRPSRRNLSFSAAVTYPLGEFSASLSLNANSAGGKALRGLPMASVVLPADSPWSPFAGDVVLTRPFAGDRALRSENSSRSLGMTFSLTGNVGQWQTSLVAGYSRIWTASLLERGIDMRRVLELVDSGDIAFNPFGPWSEGLLLVTRNRSRGENLNARFSVGGTVVNLPAGPLTANLSVDVSRSLSEARASDSGMATEEDYGQAAGQISFSVPVSSRGEGEAWSLGELSADLSANAQKASRTGLQKRYGGGLNWSPFPALQLRGAIDTAESAPSFDQLGGPIVTTTNRIFDYARQETVDVIWTTGGTPGLGRGSLQSLSLDARLQPFSNPIVALNFSYSAQVARGGVTGLPELTPAVEAAFPERVTRDTAGRLIAIDASPVNIAHSSNVDLASGITLRLPSQGGKRGGPPKPGADPLQFSISLNHRYRLKSEVLIRAGLPVIDQLGEDGGQSRHAVSLQITAGKRALGAALSGNWSSPARLRNLAPTGGGLNLRFVPAPVFNMSFFVEPEHILPDPARFSWMKEVKLSLDVQNLTNGYRRVTLADGRVPAGFSRDEIDPLGRTIRLSLRKRF
jgi:hypothetical protein